VAEAADKGFSRVSYRFRLTFHHPVPGFFRFEEQSVPIKIENKHDWDLTARDADKLIDATKFHIESRGYSDERMARESGERLRLRLRVLNAMLSLGLCIPTIDSFSGMTSPEIKSKVLSKTGYVALDTISGLCIIPDDDRHFEYVWSARVEAYPSDHQYLLNAIRDIWPIAMILDDRTEDALNILNIAATESSPRARFLTAYLALERMIDRSPRSEEAKKLIRSFEDGVNSSQLSDKDKISLKGALESLHVESFKSALLQFSERIREPKEISGLPVRDFFSKCVDTRNKIAHNAKLGPEINLQDLSLSLTREVLSLIWTTHGIPSISIFYPGSSVSFGPTEIRAL
jgi:hypothetical protein